MGSYFIHRQLTRILNMHIYISYFYSLLPNTQQEAWGPVCWLRGLRHHGNWGMVAGGPKQWEQEAASSEDLSRSGGSDSGQSRAGSITHETYSQWPTDFSKASNLQKWHLQLEIVLTFDPLEDRLNSNHENILHRIPLNMFRSNSMQKTVASEQYTWVCTLTFIGSSLSTTVIWSWQVDWLIRIYSDLGLIQSKSSKFWIYIERHWEDF